MFLAECHIVNRSELAESDPGGPGLNPQRNLCLVAGGQGKDLELEE